MVNIGSWKFWVIVALALGTLACAGRAERRERREMARQERLERREAARAERQRAQEEKRAQREAAQPRAVEAEAPPPQPTRQTAAASFAPVAAPVTAAAVADGSSKLVFMRVSKQTSSTEAALYDVTDPGGPRFIGTVGAASKVAYSLSPGLHTFMVVGETAEFMQANVAGGKTYYALVIPKAGAKRFAVEPVRQNEIGGKEFASWDRATRPVNAGQGTANAADAADKRSRYWGDWVRKAESERAELTINADDGR